MIAEASMTFSLVHTEALATSASTHDNDGIINSGMEGTEAYLTAPRRAESLYECGQVGLTIWRRGFEHDQTSYAEARIYPRDPSLGVEGALGCWQVDCYPTAPAPTYDPKAATRPLLTSASPVAFSAFSAAQHVLRIVWTATTIQFYLDGVLVRETVPYDNSTLNAFGSIGWRVKGLARIYSTQFTLTDGRVYDYQWSDPDQLLDWQLDPLVLTEGVHPAVVDSDAWLGLHYQQYPPVQWDLINNPAQPTAQVKPTYLTTPNIRGGCWGWRLFSKRSGGRHTIIDRSGRTKDAYVHTDLKRLMFQRIEEFHDITSWSTPAVIYAGTGPTCPCLVDYDGSLVCWYMEGGTQRARVSRDDGRTWQELTAMLGSNLTNLYAICKDGMTWAVGVRGSYAYFCRSNDNGVTQTPLPGGATEQLIGGVGWGSRPCITFEEDGEMVCYAQNATGTRVEYYNRNRGVGPWTLRTA